MTTTAQRTELKKVMDYLYVHRAKVHYPRNDIRVEMIHTVKTMAQLETLVNRPQGLTIDCSQMFTLLMLVAGLKNPNGADEDGATGSLLDSPLLHKYSDPAAAYIGAGVVFGGGSGHHIATVYERGKNPLLFSHGQESDPRLIRLSDEKRGQEEAGHYGVTMLSIAHL